MFTKRSNDLICFSFASDCVNKNSSKWIESQLWAANKCVTRCMFFFLIYVLGNWICHRIFMSVLDVYGRFLTQYIWNGKSCWKLQKTESREIMIHTNFTNESPHLDVAEMISSFSLSRKTVCFWFRDLLSSSYSLRLVLEWHCAHLEQDPFLFLLLNGLNNSIE